MSPSIVGIESLTKTDEPRQRVAAMDGIDHMPWWAILPALVAFTAGMSRLGLRGFLKRVLTWSHKGNGALKLLWDNHILERRVSYRL